MQGWGQPVAHQVQSPQGSVTSGGKGPRATVACAHHVMLKKRKNNHLHSHPANVKTKKHRNFQIRPWSWELLPKLQP